MATALKAVHERTPVVVIDGSGKAASVLSYAWRYLHSSEYVVSLVILMSIIEIFAYL